jgi:hypothetical protein
MINYVLEANVRVILRFRPETFLTLQALSRDTNLVIILEVA